MASEEEEEEEEEEESLEEQNVFYSHKSSSCSTTNSGFSRDVLVIPLVNSITQQLYQLETCVKSCSETTHWEDIYEQMYGYSVIRLSYVH
jgi:hypothetical protein